METAGYLPGEEISLAVDAASSEWMTAEGIYRTPKGQKTYTSENLAAYWEDLAGAGIPWFPWRTAWRRTTGRGGVS